MKGMSPLGALARPRVVVPVVLSLALLGFVLSISDAPRVVEQIRRIPVATMGLCFGLALGYLVLKGIQFRLFLGAIGIHADWRHVALAFAIGEMSLTAPAGIYAQNYVLSRIAGADFSRSSAATTAALVVEGWISLIVLAVLGIPGWGWLRPAILSFFVAAAAAILAMIVVAPVGRLTARLVQTGPLKTAGRELLAMVKELRVLFEPRVMVRAAPLTAAYLFSLVAGFYLVAHGVGVASFTFLQATTVYIFALAIVLMSPVSSHLGMVEAGGLGAMQAWGYNATEGLAMMLGFRLVWTGSIWLACGLAALLLRSEWR